MALITIQMFLLGLAGLPLKLPGISSLVIIEIICLLIWIYRLNINLLESHRDPIIVISTGRFRLIKNIVESSCIIWIIVKLVSIFTETYLRPIYTFDAYVNWSVRAKVFYYSNSLLLDPSAYDFFGRGIIHSSGNYPPFNPLAQMWTALWIGSFDEVLVKIWMPAYLISAVVFLYIVALRDTNRIISLLLVTIFLSSPLMSLHATDILSDLPLAVYIFFALNAMQNVIRGRWAYLPLIGLFAVCAMFLKGEGMFIAIPLFIASCYVVWTEVRKGKYPKISLVVSLFVPYLLIVPWMIFRYVHKLGYGIDERYSTIVFRPIMIWEYLRTIIELQNFNVIFIFIPIMLLFYGKFDRELSLMLLVIGFYLLFFLSVYVFVAFYSDNNRFFEGVFRNILTYYPASLLIITLLIKRLLQKETAA
jgi:hypothetical protein